MRRKLMFLVMIFSSTLYTADRSQKPLTSAAFLCIEPDDTDAEIMEKMARLMRQDAGVDSTDDEDLIVLSPVCGNSESSMLDTERTPISSCLLPDNSLFTMEYLADAGGLTPDVTSCIGPWSTHTVQEPVRVYPRLCAVAVQQSMLVVAGAGPQLGSVAASALLEKRRERGRFRAKQFRERRHAEKEQAEQEARAQAFAASVAACSFVPLSIPPRAKQNSLECPEALTLQTLTPEPVAVSEQVSQFVAASSTVANTRTGVSLVCPHCKVTFAYETCFKKHMGTTSDPHKTCPILLKQWRLQARDGSKKQ